MIVDSHVHTSVSSDCKMPLEAALKRANELGIGMTLTEHMDLKYPEEGLFLFDPDEYFKKYEAYKSPALRLGIEVGMRTDCAKENLDIIRAHPYDFVLGSVHMVHETDIYHAEFYEGKPKEMVYGWYFQTIIDCLMTHPDLDALGHIDYIARYARYPDTEIYYEHFRHYIDEILHLVIEREMALEFNTRRLFDAPKAAYVLDTIYRRYHELGGRLVTLGSDAHKPEAVGKDFADALALCRRWGLRPVYYEGRRPQDIK